MKAHKQDDISTRLALLEQSHSQIIDILSEIRGDIREIRKETALQRENTVKEFKEIREQKSTEFNSIRDEIKSMRDQTASEYKSMREQFTIEFKIIREHVDSRLDRINNRLWSLFFWMIGGGGSILYIIAKTNRWLN